MPEKFLDLGCFVGPVYLVYPSPGGEGLSTPGKRCDYYGSLVILLVFGVDFLVSLIQSVKMSEHLRVLEERLQEARQALDRLKEANDGQKALLEKRAEELRRLADQRIEATVKRFRLI